MPLDLQQPQPAALITAVMAPDDEVLQAVGRDLAEAFGPVSKVGPTYPFAFSRYYDREMGAGLTKQLLWFEDLVDPAQLAQIKGRAMDLERQWAQERDGALCRRVNIDPGLVTIESLVLATTKYSGHRICIAPALYAEVTLLYQKGQYRPFEWTYADYQDPKVGRFLLEIRADLMARRQA